MKTANIFGRPFSDMQLARLLAGACVVLYVVIFAVLFTGLGEEFYRCEILEIPNCD